LRELFVLFLRIGVTAFGGPAAHIAVMKHEVVDRLNWMSEDEFLDLLSATNLIPGPNSTEMAIHIGLHRAGLRGLLVAGAAFILPAVFMVAALARAYQSYGSLPQIASLLYAVKPVMIAIILQAIVGLAGKARRLPLLALLCLILALWGVDELLLLFGAGAWMGLRRWWTGAVSVLSLCRLTLVSLAFITLPNALTAMQGAGPVPFGMAPLFLFFLKVGATLYGSGYVLLAFLRSTLVEQWGWLSAGQLLDAIAVGQVTPGPVFTTATFVGYLLGGPTAAALATVAIFLPSFFWVALSGPWIPRLRSWPLASAFLDGVNVASLALMAAVTVQLVRTSISDGATFVIAIASLALLVKTRINATWLIGAAACFGLIQAL